ncbi:NAD-P-binding protein [Trametes polyzona]|nr:NAD-P-binding protein [Trametes polyzona]
MSLVAALKAMFPGKPAWSASQLPDLSRKVMLVTGGNTGIGKETVKRLLMKNAKVYLATRSQDRAERAIEQLREETGKSALFLPLDLSDLTSVKKAAEEYKRHESRLDALVLNAGLVYPPADRPLTAQGYETTFGVNVVGHYLLSRLLYPHVAASSSEHEPSRIVWLSSSASLQPRKLDYGAFKEGPARAKAHPFLLYAQSKLAAVMLSMHLARTGAKDNIVSIAVDPGSVKSEIYRSSPWYIRTTDWLYSYPVEYGALGPLYAAAMPEAAKYNEEYLKPWASLGQPNPVARDVHEQEKLHTWLEEEVQAYVQ